MVWAGDYGRVRSGRSIRGISDRNFQFLSVIFLTEGGESSQLSECEGRYGHEMPYPVKLYVCHDA